MTPELLASIVGAVLALGFAYIPGLNTKWATLSPETKKLVTLGLLVLSAAGVYAYTCIPVFSVVITCDKAGIIELVKLVIAAVIANQGVERILPLTKSVRKAKG